MEEGGFGDDDGGIATKVVSNDVLAWELVGIGAMEGGRLGASGCRLALQDFSVGIGLEFFAGGEGFASCDE